MAHVSLSATAEGDHAVITFTKGGAQVILRFPNTDDAKRDEIADDLGFLLDNIGELVDSANVEIEAALLRREMADE